MPDNRQTHRWYERCPSLLKVAIDEAQRLQHAYVGVEHLFNAMTREPGSQTAVLLKSLGCDAAQVRDAIRREAGMGKGTAPGVPQLTPRLLTILQLAEQHVGLDAAISETHVLRALFEEGDSLPVRYFMALGYTPAAFMARLDALGALGADQTRLAASPEAVDATRISAAMTPPPVASVSPSPTILPSGLPITPHTTVPVSIPTPTLDHWGRDLAKLARLGKLAEAIGRDREIEQIITVLARTQKSNPLLLGEAGVGKTAIVEGAVFAGRITPGAVYVTAQAGGITFIPAGKE